MKIFYLAIIVGIVSSIVSGFYILLNPIINKSHNPGDMGMRYPTPQLPGMVTLLNETGSTYSKPTIDVARARELAENSVDELKTSYGCHFDSISGIFSADSTNVSKLEAVRVGYNCNHPYVGAFVITEDPQLTKVINVTAYQNNSFEGSGRR